MRISFDLHFMIKMFLFCCQKLQGQLLPCTQVLSIVLPRLASPGMFGHMSVTIVLEIRGLKPKVLIIISITDPFSSLQSGMRLMLQEACI